MTNGEKKPKRWQFSMRVMFVAATCASVSLALFVLATSYGQLWTLIGGTTGAYCFGGSIGGLLGWMRRQSPEDVLHGFISGGLLATVVWGTWSVINA